MSDNDDDKVVRLGGRRKNSLENDLLDIAKLLSDDSATSEKRSVSEASTTITGSHNTVGNNNFINHGVLNILPPPVQKRVYVKTGDGVIDSAQKGQLKTLLYEWVDTHNAIKKVPITYGSAWVRLNNHVHVNSYHEIKATDFSKALKYLRTQLGQLRNMASAPKKVSTWRADTIKSIQARCSQMKWQEWRKSYMAKTFDKASMTELTDKELQQLYQTVWNKK